MQAMFGQPGQDIRDSTQQWMGDRRLATLNGGFHNIPPVTLISAEDDLLRDDARVLEQVLLNRGIPCKRLHYLRATHGFYTFDFLPEAHE